MNRDWNSIMFDNIGTKIKMVAKVTAWVEILFSILAGIGMILYGVFDLEYYWYLIFLAPIAVVLGCISAWLSVIVLYGFGELVEKACGIHSKLGYLAQPAIEAHRAAEERARAEASARYQQEARARAAQKEREAQLRAMQMSREGTKQEVRERAIREAEERLAWEAEEKAKQQAEQTREKTLEEKLAYALEYSTDEGMLRYLSTIDDEKVKQILQQPADRIRGLVEQAAKGQ